MKKNILTVVLAILGGLFLLYAFQQKSFANQAMEEVAACKQAAAASSAEAFILQELAEKHKAEAEEHRIAAEEHKKIAEEAIEKLNK